MYFKFEKIIIWQKAMTLGEKINALTTELPRKEMYNISSQIMRAADSVALNIAESSISQTNPESRRFMGYSIRSLAEVVTCLHKARNREYSSLHEFEELYAESYHLMNMMIAFKRNIN